MSTDLFDTAPVRSGKLRSAGLGADGKEKAFRLHMHKVGFKWSAQYPWNIAVIPTFSDTMKANAKQVMSFKQGPDQ